MEKHDTFKSAKEYLQELKDKKQKYDTTTKLQDLSLWIEFRLCQLENTSSDGKKTFVTVQDVEKIENRMVECVEKLLETYDEQKLLETYVDDIIPETEYDLSTINRKMDTKRAKK